MARTITIHEEQKGFKSLIDMIRWMADMHRKYLEYVIANPGHYHKSEEWSKNTFGEYIAYISITQDVD
jgi:hypothetical protein